MILSAVVIQRLFLRYSASFSFTRFNEFDHKFFGISEAEANFMDPQQKLLLHCSHRALENSGIPMEKVSGSRTGVYIGNNSDSVFSINGKIDHYRTDIIWFGYWHSNASGTALMYIFGSCCFSGLMNRDYETLLNNSPSTISHYNGTGTAMSIAANRISYTFNLTGPSFAIDSACSSSLVALHSACQAIRQGKTILILKYRKAAGFEKSVWVNINLS